MYVPEYQRNNERRVIFIKLNITFSSLIVPLEVPLSSLENPDAASPSCDDK